MSRLSLVTLCLAVFTAQARGITVEDCPLTLTRDVFLQVFRDNCYEFVLYRELEFDTAKDDCRSRGGDLVKIYDRATQDFLYKQLRETYGQRDEVWIGLTDKNAEDTWEWMDGSVPEYSNWAPGQPGVVHGLEDCAALDPDDGGRWHDYKCEDLFIFVDAGHKYICQYKSTYRPPQTTTERIQVTDTSYPPQSTTQRIQVTDTSYPPQSTTQRIQVTDTSYPPQSTTQRIQVTDTSYPPQSTTQRIQVTDTSYPPQSTTQRIQVTDTSYPPQSTTQRIQVTDTSYPPQSTTQRIQVTDTSVPPQSTTMTNPPQSTTMTNPPQSTTMTNPPQSTTMTNPPQSTTMTNPPQSTTMTNPPQTTTPIPATTTTGKPDACPPFACALDCGLSPYKRDSQGCPLCECDV